MKMWNKWMVHSYSSYETRNIWFRSFGTWGYRQCQTNPASNRLTLRHHFLALKQGTADLSVPITEQLSLKDHTCGGFLKLRYPQIIHFTFGFSVKQIIQLWGLWKLPDVFSVTRQGVVDFPFLWHVLRLLKGLRAHWHIGLRFFASTANPSGWWWVLCSWRRFHQNICAYYVYIMCIYYIYYIFVITMINCHCHYYVFINIYIYMYR